MLHGEIQERLGSVEGVDAARPPGAVVDEGEPLAQDQQAFAHEVGCEVPENQSVDQVGLGNETMGIILHLLDLIEQALPSEFLVQRNGSEEPAPGAEVECMRRHTGDHPRFAAWCVPHRACVARRAVQIHEVEAPIVAHGHSDWQIVTKIFAFLVDHSKRGITASGLLVGQVLGEEYLPDKKPGRGYSSFGMIYEKGKNLRYDLPVGVSMRNYRGLDLVYLNCASCHTGTVRDAPGSEPRVVPGMPAHTFDLGAWGRFLTSVPLDQKFTGQRLLDQIEKMQDDSHRLVAKPDLINRSIFRYFAADLMRERLLILRQRLAFIDNSTWGPGRVDTFNAPKALLNFPMEHVDPKELIGNADFPSVWNQLPRKGMQLHWDGNNTSVDERNLSAAFGTGAYPPTLDTERVLRTAKWLETAQPLPFPYRIDGPLAGKGAPIYQEYCAGCHGTREAPYHHNPPQNDERVGTVVPIEDIGTDRHRLDSYTWLLAVNQSTLYAGYEKDWGFDEPYPQRFSHFRKTKGYANSPLDGIWLRAPYLHNGSVPSCASCSSRQRRGPNSSTAATTSMIPRTSVSSPLSPSRMGATSSHSIQRRMATTILATKARATEQNSRWSRNEPFSSTSRLSDRRGEDLLGTSTCGEKPSWPSPSSR